MDPDLTLEKILDLDHTMIKNAHLYRILFIVIKYINIYSKNTGHFNKILYLNFLLTQYEDE